MANFHGQDALLEADSFLQSRVHGHLKIDADSTEYPVKDRAKREKKRRIRTWISKICGYNRHWLHRINHLYHMSKRGNYGKRNTVPDTVVRVTDSSSNLVQKKKQPVTDASIDKPSAESSVKRHLFVKGTRKRKATALCHEEKRSDRKAMERSFRGRKAFKVTLANIKSEKKHPACDLVATKYADLAVLNKEDNILEVSHITPQRAPVACLRKKLLILDVNGLLADIVHPPPKECKADTNILRRAIFKRPFCYDFLKFCFERFNVGIWSSRTKKIIDRVVDYLFGDMKYKLLFCWDLSHCTGTGFKTLENKHKELVFKDLRKLWEKDDTNLPWEKGDYNESNTLLLDDSPYKALLNPMHTGIFPYSYNFKDSCDTSLGADGDIQVYLRGFAAADDVRNYVKAHPFGQRAIDQTSTSWEYYHKVISDRSLVLSTR